MECAKPKEAEKRSRLDSLVKIKGAAKYQLRVMRFTLLLCPQEFGIKRTSNLHSLLEQECFDFRSVTAIVNPHIDAWKCCEFTFAGEFIVSHFDWFHYEVYLAVPYSNLTGSVSLITLFLKQVVQPVTAFRASISETMVSLALKDLQKFYLVHQVADRWVRTWSDGSEQELPRTIPHNFSKRIMYPEGVKTVYDLSWFHMPTWKATIGLPDLVSIGEDVPFKERHCFTYALELEQLVTYPFSQQYLQVHKIKDDQSALVFVKDKKLLNQYIRYCTKILLPVQVRFSIFIKRRKEGKNFYLSRVFYWSELTPFERVVCLIPVEMYGEVPTVVQYSLNDLMLMFEVYENTVVEFKDVPKDSRFMHHTKGVIVDSSLHELVGDSCIFYGCERPVTFSIFKRLDSFMGDVFGLCSNHALKVRMNKNLTLKDYLKVTSKKYAGDDLIDLSVKGPMGVIEWFSDYAFLGSLNEFDLDWIEYVQEAQKLLEVEDEEVSSEWIQDGDDGIEVEFQTVSSANPMTFFELHRKTELPDILALFWPYVRLDAVDSTETSTAIANYQLSLIHFVAASHDLVQEAFSDYVDREVSSSDDEEVVMEKEKVNLKMRYFFNNYIGEDKHSGKEEEESETLSSAYDFMDNFDQEVPELIDQE